MSDFMLNQPSMGGWEYPGFPLQILSHNCGHFLQGRDTEIWLGRPQYEATAIAQRRA